MERETAAEAIDRLAGEASELREQLTAAHARIAELERCVVMGGDGKPITVGEYKFPVTDDAPLSIRVKSIFKDEYGAVIIETDVDGYSPNPKELYSSPDSVPEGDK